MYGEAGEKGRPYLEEERFKTILKNAEQEECKEERALRSRNGD